MLSDVWPLCRLVIATPRLELRLPREDEIAELAALAARGVHPPGERPFLTQWTEGSSADRAQSVRLRLTRERWWEFKRPSVTVTGLADCPAFFDESAAK